MPASCAASLAGLGAAALAACALAQALSISTDGCEFCLQAGGAIAGPVGEMASGQVRAGEGISSSNFTIRGAGELWDDNGHGCWWTPPTLVLQCDVGQAPQQGFAIGCDGVLSFLGQRQFFECETGEPGQYNVYLEDGHEGHCGRVMLTADACRRDDDSCPAATTRTTTGSPSSSILPSTGSAARSRAPLGGVTVPAAPPRPTWRTSCSLNLDGAFEFPHLIVAVDSARPDEALGTSFFGRVSPTTSSLFNFDIPRADKGKTCTLVFLLPLHEELQTASYNLSGPGRLGISQLEAPAGEGATWATRPGRWRGGSGGQGWVGTAELTVAPGNGYEVATFECPAGERIGIEMEGDGDGGTRLEFFQDWNPAALGLYIRKC